MPFLSADNSGPIEIRYEEWGAGEPLVLIGGLTSTLEVWSLMRPILETRHRVIAADNRGSGQTRMSSDDRIRTPERFAGDLLALLDGLGIDRAHIAGASMGGMIAQAFALAAPERIASLAILCSTPGGERAVRASGEVLETMFRGAAEGADADAARRAIETIAHPESPEQRPDAMKFFAENRRAHPHSREELGMRAAGLATFDVYDRLETLDVPTLVLTGSHDKLIPKENAALLSERIPSAQLVEIADAGHILFVEQPVRVARALLDFTSRNPIQ